MSACRSGLAIGPKARSACPAPGWAIVRQIRIAQRTHIAMQDSGTDGWATVKGHKREEAR